jgi:hypothetical protein
LWGRFSQKELDMWEKAGFTNKPVGHSHFTLHPFEEIAVPENWHLTRADLDF